MKKYIQLVYRSFFNLSANKEFIKNGKGSGAALLCLVALLFTVIYMIRYSKEVLFYKYKNYIVNYAWNGTTTSEKKFHMNFRLIVLASH